ncbi:hypothetical protein J4G52_32785, partial [Burkholderia cenocepacia]|uniref:hypothetical protein n=1 Tax=Burkholderia cenocepacia TaxID=95486 RepID=UPI001AA126A7
AVRLRLEISDEPVCYPVRRAIYAGARITGCSTASPTKTRTGSALTLAVATPLDTSFRILPNRRTDNVPTTKVR